MKKFLSLVVAALLSVGAVTTASAAKFTDVDVKNEALNDAVELLTALNVTKGTTETTFGTEENVTRQQMAAFIYRMMKAGKSVEGGVNTTSFTDLDDSTFYFMVSWANSQGIIKGRSATTFDPKGGITLQDAYTMIVRALGYDDGTLAYPISYISLAEDLGLDEDLPSTLNYTDTLTRGNVAIILANMFYAETAEVEIKYEASYKWVEYPEGSGNWQVVSNGQVPKEYHKTVAEAIFEVEKISQRVVATPNYSFENFEKPEEDIEMITLSKDYVIDYEDYETEIPSLGQIEFAELGLDGKADDYFLNDIVMFVKVTEDDEYEIFGATATGTKTTVSFADVEFGTVNGTTAEKYYDGSEKNYKMVNGKLTLGDTVTYLYDAPYSFAKDQDLNKYNAQFIALDAYDGDMESEDEADHVKFNYVLEDIEADETIIGWYMNEDDVWVKNYDAYLAQVYFGGAGEIDVYDCDGNGKPDYLFVKNFVVGTIDDTEEEDVQDLDAEDLATVADDLIIYTDYSIVEGEAEDDDVVLAYVNPTANYVKIAEVLTGKDATVATSASKYFALSTGEKIYYKDAQAVVLNGAENLKAVDPDADIDFDAEATYYFTAEGKLVYVTGLATAISLDANYVVVLEDAAFQTTAMVDGKLEKAYYIDIYNDGEIKSVKAKQITEYRTNADEEAAAAGEHVKTPLTGAEGEYDYTAYLNKLATGKSDKKGAYYFELVDFTINKDASKLLDKEDETLEYRATGVNTTFELKSGNVYELADATAANAKIKGVYVKDYTQIIIRSRDEDNEWIVTAYGADNLPDIKEGTVFTNVSYVLVNNKSTMYENLAVFYGVIDDELEGATGEMAEVRVVRSYSKSSTEDGTVYTYDVFNPLDGKVEAGVVGAETDAAGFTKGAIVGLTTEGLIDDSVAAAGNAFTAGEIYNVDGLYDFEDYGTERKLGYVKVDEYDETTKYLMTDAAAYADALLQVTDATVVTFADKSEETIKVVDAEVLGSTAKTYRQDENKAEALRVFLCIEENEDADDDELVYDILFAMIVRD